MPFLRKDRPPDPPRWAHLMDVSHLAEGIHGGHPGHPDSEAVRAHVDQQCASTPQPTDATSMPKLAADRTWVRTPDQRGVASRA